MSSSPVGRTVYSPVVSVSEMSSFSQVMMGCGTPSATQVSKAWVFSTTDTSEFPSRMEGGTGVERKRDKMYVLYCTYSLFIFLLLEYYLHT